MQKFRIQGRRERDELINTEQQMLQDIAGLKENQITLFKRVEKNENLITQIHRLTATVESLAEEMKKQNDKITLQADLECEEGVQDMDKELPLITNTDDITPANCPEMFAELCNGCVEGDLEGECADE